MLLSSDAVICSGQTLGSIVAERKMLVCSGLLGAAFAWNVNLTTLVVAVPLILRGSMNSTPALHFQEMWSFIGYPTHRL
jgi:hypothetical protein